MRSVTFALAALLVLGSVARAEDKPNPEQLKKAYDDALVQLKSAQDSKNALARQNAELTKQIDDLKKQLATAGGQIQDLRRQVADNDEKSFELRSFRAAWKSFMRVHPDLLVRWKLFLSDDVLSLPQEPLRMIDPTRPTFDSQAGID